MPGDFYEDFARWLPELVKADAVQDPLAEALGIGLDRLGVEPPWGVLLATDYATIHDTLLELLSEQYETVVEIKAYGGYGAFPIEVRRLGPAFWVSAQEFDDSGLFPSASEAECWARSDYDAFLCHDGGNCPICGAPYEYENFGNEPCGHWLLTCDETFPFGSDGSCPLGLWYFEGNDFDGSQMDALSAAVDSALEAAQSTRVLAQATAWDWMDHTIRDLLASVAKAADDEGTRDSSRDRDAFQHYIEAVVNLGHFGQEWTFSEISVPGASSAYAQLWAERSGDLDQHLCRLVAAHAETVREFTASMSNKSGPKSLPARKPNLSQQADVTSAGVPWSEVPDFAKPDVAWIDGRGAHAETVLPGIDEIPIPEILELLPVLHENRPRGSKAMLDAAGARSRLAALRPGAWLISPFTGWKWAVWHDGHVGWLPADIVLPTELKVGSPSPGYNGPGQESQ